MNCRLGAGFGQDGNDPECRLVLSEVFIDSHLERVSQSALEISVFEGTVNKAAYGTCDILPVSAEETGQLGFVHQVF